MQTKNILRILAEYKQTMEGYKGYYVKLNKADVARQREAAKQAGYRTWTLFVEDAANRYAKQLSKKSTTSTEDKQP